MRIFFYLLIIFLGAGKLTPAFGAGPSPSPSPLPLPTPRSLLLELYFQRAAKIIPSPADNKFEIVEEVPFLTQSDFLSIEVKKSNERYSLAITLNPPGQQKLTEAAMGNIGRTVIVVLTGTIRNKFTMTTRSGPFVHLKGDFTKQEAFQLGTQVNTRPSPSPTPAALPTPSPRQKISVY